jgi:hypothetical protein
LVVREEPTTAVVQRYLDALAGDVSAEPIVRELLDRTVHRLGRLWARADGWRRRGKVLAEFVLASDRRTIKVRDQDGWICHVLRRGAETMILPD